MWVVAKIKIKNLNTFKKDVIDKVGNDTKFYQPKFEYHKFFGSKIKKFEKFILENYILCYNEKFKKNNYVNEIRYLKGLEYFLEGYNQNQKQILKFIEYCKLFENDKGFITQSFFQNIVTKKARFVSGPFTNMIFEIIEKQKNKLKILVGNIVTTIPNKANYLYRPI
tara:strand:- start:164 stop:664 length:501 start_codon:yes stop_codon:yes gene_type:complete